VIDELKEYRRRILAAYTVAGVAFTLIAVWASTSELSEEIPLSRALMFLVVMLTPMCMGNIVARDIASVEDSWSPFDHLNALRAEGPIVLFVLAAMLAIDLGLDLMGLRWLIVIPTLIAGWILNSRLWDPR
jgi:NADH:ubiquinone oxidoreductase subunit 2 (subunit N)